MSSVLVRLYPARWRDRYGDEFEALLDERPLGPFDVADIILGALDAQLRLRGRGTEINRGKGLSMSLRIGGIAAILGSALLVVAVILSLRVVGDVGGFVSSVLVFTGLAALLVAIAGLSAFQARAYPRLAWFAFALPAIGTLVCGLGIVGMSLFGDRPFIGGVSGWYPAFLGAMAALAGCALFAIATFRTAALSRGAAVLVGFGSTLPFLGAANLVTVAVAPFIQPLMSASVVCFLVGWLALGIQAIRLDRRGTLRPA
jgi:hypothetical protein